MLECTEQLADMSLQQRSKDEFTVDCGGNPKSADELDGLFAVNDSMNVMSLAKLMQNYRVWKRSRGVLHGCES